MWTESSSVADGSPCCHCRPSRSCSMRLATGSEQRWSPRCWVRQETAEGFRFGPQAESNCQDPWIMRLTALPGQLGEPHGDLDVAVAVPGYFGHAELLVEGP